MREETTMTNHEDCCPPRYTLKQIQEPAITSMSTLSNETGMSGSQIRQHLAENGASTVRQSGTEYARTSDVKRILAIASRACRRAW